MSSTQGNILLAESLAFQGIKHCFGIVGIPVIELGFALQASNINYYGCRNEQAAAYAAGAVGYMTKTPGLCLAVSGPGLTNCISGLANALMNCWPMILVAGSSDENQKEREAFQEIDQIQAVKPFCKLAIRITDPQTIPFLVQKACRFAVTGRPGPVYLDIPGDVLSCSVLTSSIIAVPPQKYLPTMLPPSHLVEAASNLIKKAKRPLIIIGKGAAYSFAGGSTNVLKLVENNNLPFLPTPMGKGLISDEHRNCVSAARSLALGKADLIVLVGARLNWILHFGKPPRFDKDVKVVQIDVCAEEMGHNADECVPLLGDCELTVNELDKKLEGFKFPAESEWWMALKKKCVENEKASEILMSDPSLPLTYYSAYKLISSLKPAESMLVNEGANTMDIGRTILKQTKAKTRLDAGTFGTMGVGFPFILASKAVDRDRPVLAVLGDSAFGFSAMEMETLVRYGFGAVIVILNNNGIYTGVESLNTKGENNEIPVTALNPEARYEKMAEAFGGRGFLVNTHEELEKALLDAFKTKDELIIINVLISPYGTKKPQEHAWLTRESPKSKL